MSTMEALEAFEAPEAALDMRVIRAGHDKIPLARIERRGSGAARSSHGAPGEEQSLGESVRQLKPTCAINMLLTVKRRQL